MSAFRLRISGHPCVRYYVLGRPSSLPDVKLCETRGTPYPLAVLVVGLFVPALQPVVWGKRKILLTTVTGKSFSQVLPGQAARRQDAHFRRRAVYVAVDRDSPLVLRGGVLTMVTGNTTVHLPPSSGWGRKHGYRQRRAEPRATSSIYLGPGINKLSVCCAFAAGGWHRRALRLCGQAQRKPPVGVVNSPAFFPPDARYGLAPFTCPQVYPENGLSPPLYGTFTPLVLIGSVKQACPFAQSASTPCCSWSNEEPLKTDLEPPDKA